MVLQMVVTVILLYIFFGVSKLSD